MRERRIPGATCDVSCRVPPFASRSYGADVTSSTASRAERHPSRTFGGAIERIPPFRGAVPPAGARIASQSVGTRSTTSRPEWSSTSGVGIATQHVRWLARTRAGMSTGMRAVTSLLLCTLALPAGAASDPASPGSLAIGVTTVDVVDASRNRTLGPEVWYPARIPGRDARMRGGRRPLVIVVHGHCGSRTNYTYLTTHLATRGYLVAAPDLPRFCATRDGVDV